ncbi:hypothetical protein G9C84_13710 [Halolamina sp. R1-12]|uniref:DUF8071 domain-containing protein n=1 Tax=Halolamina pelagica TaxID=699431 RepID=A0A1I5W9R0_9EURY|nr:hypothetical protein [Halolamina sp. R1-12]SFQ16421.1 hypothetical protein SAMN05216277_12510 [Halolamina pelagica]
MRPDRSSLQRAFRKSVSALVRSIAWLTAATRSAGGAVWRSVRRLTRLIQAHWQRGRHRTSEFLSGPAKQFVSGPLRVVLVGRRTDVSLLAVLLAPVLALAATWWVGSTVGYETLATWVRGTWFGTAPSLAVFVAAGALIVLGAISAAANSGVLPTSLLVSAPIFGAAVTRYGTTVTYTWGTEVVSLPNAVGMAILLALGFGLPIAVTGFILGGLVRRIVTVFRGQSGPAAPVKNP